jgi:hypothetical protein
MAGLDNIDADPVKPFGYGHFYMGVKKKSRSLLTFTQSSIQYGNHDRPAPLQLGHAS